MKWSWTDLIGPIVWLLALIIFGVGSQYFFNRQDNAVEEYAEQTLEGTIENYFNLEKGALEDCIDLTPNSNEKE